MNASTLTGQLQALRDFLQPKPTFRQESISFPNNCGKNLIFIFSAFFFEDLICLLFDKYTKLRN